MGIEGFVAQGGADCVAAGVYGTMADDVVWHPSDLRECSRGGRRIRSSQRNIDAVVCVCVRVLPFIYKLVSGA